MDSISSIYTFTPSPFVQSQPDPFNDFLGLIDVNFLTACEYTNFRKDLTDVGKRISPAHGHVLGAGGTYIVRRTPYNSSDHRVAALGECRPETEREPRFVVLKQQKFIEAGVRVQDIHRMRSSMMEMKILRHQPIRDHPNIIKLLQMRWDVQDDSTFNFVLPSVIMEYGDFGTLADFQDPELLALNSETKTDICLGIARGLQFLHDCKIVHGDIKTEYVSGFDFVTQSYYTNVDGLETSCYAKLMRKLRLDMGILRNFQTLESSSLIEVFDNKRKRQIPSETKGYAVPECRMYLDAAGLLQLDIYSFGILVWRVMLNGVAPWKLLTKTYGEVEVIDSTISDLTVANLEIEEFDSLKKTGQSDMIYDLAKRTLQNCCAGDVDLQIVCDVLYQTLHREPSLRAKSFGGIISLLQNSSSFSGKTQGSKSRNADFPEPEPLHYGDFNIDSLSLPWQIFALSTCPVSFRQLICTEMFRVMHQLDDSEPDPRKVKLKLALAISHIQNFAPTPSMQFAADLLYQCAKEGSTRAQIMCKPVCDAAGLPYHINELETWLLGGIQRGSPLSRLNLDPVISRVIEKRMANSRLRLGDRWLTVIQVSDQEYRTLKLTIDHDIDEVFKFFYVRTNFSKLHIAALTGNPRLLQELLDRGADIDSKNAHGETPLHYACISGSISAIKVLCEAGASVNAQSDLCATPVHYAILSNGPSDAVQFVCEQQADLEISSKSMESLQESEESVFSDYYFRLVGTPLAWAIIMENSGAASILLEHGANPFHRYPQQANPPAWQLAFTNRSLDLIGMMLLAGKQHNRILPNFDEIVPFLGNQFTTPLRLLLHGNTNRRQFTKRVSDLLQSVDVDVDEMGIICANLDVELFPEEENVRIVDEIISKNELKPNKEYGVYRYRLLNSDTVVERPLSFGSFLSAAVFGGSIGMTRMLSRHIGTLSTTIAPQDALFKEISQHVPLKETYFEILCRNPRRSLHEMQDFTDCLLSHGAERNARGSLSLHGESSVCPLKQAVTYHRLTAIQAFLDNGIGDVRGALGAALADSNSLLSLPIVSLLVERCPEVLLEASPMGYDALEGIATKEHKGLTAFVSILCSANELDRNDALVEKKMRIVKRVVDKKLSCDLIKAAMRTTDWSGSTLLHLAATHGNSEICKILLDMGADVNQSIVYPDLDKIITELSQSSLAQQTNTLADVQNLAPSRRPTDSSVRFQDPMVVIEPNLTGILQKGPMPLDLALQRDWTNMLCFQPFFRAELMEMHNHAADHKQRSDFQRRTDDVVRVLRSHGGKRRNEM